MHRSVYSLLCLVCLAVLAAGCLRPGAVPVYYITATLPESQATGSAEAPKGTKTPGKGPTEAAHGVKPTAAENGQSTATKVKATATPTGEHPAAANTPTAPAAPSATAGSASGGGKINLPTAPAAQQTVKIFLIGLEDAGKLGAKVGCGDSAVGVTVAIEPTQGVLRAALNKLLALKERSYGQSGLYNAMYQSDLKLSDVTIIAGAARIDLSGSVRLGGACDAPRVLAQFEQTAYQFATVKSVSVYLNGKPLKDALSGR
jgi:hypothetical protein